ncbi:MAG TPA: hypothetical protein VKV26_05000 [Dehalococcoidia bacterium]|nr:hypothetical protein [Dehalococcoidia bacterium]
MSLIVEQQGACSPTYFYFYQSTDGGQSYQYFYGGTANQLAMTYGNFAAGTNFYYAVYACDAYCPSVPGYVTVTDNGPSTTNAFNYVSGQQWFYQNTGFVNNGGGYSGFYLSSSPSGADRYLAVLQTPQPGTNLTNLGEAFTYIDAYTDNDVFYQVGYAQNAAGFEWFAATTYQGQGYNTTTRQWNGVGCASGTSRYDYYPAATGGITVRCNLSGTAPNTQQTYDVHSYTNVVYTGVNGSYILDATESNLGYMYRAAAVQEAVGGAQSPQTTFAQTSPTKATGDMVESWFQYNGQNFSTIVSDYFVNSDVFDSNRNTTSPECGLPNVASIQRETPAYPWGMRWDAGLPDC